MDTAQPQQSGSLHSVFSFFCGNFLYMPVRIYLAFFKCTASFWCVCQQQQWWGQKPSIQVCSITLLSRGLQWSFKERSRCACWLNLKQKSLTKSSILKFFVHLGFWILAMFTLLQWTYWYSAQWYQFPDWGSFKKAADSWDWRNSKTLSVCLVTPQWRRVIFGSTDHGNISMQ